MKGLFLDIDGVLNRFSTEFEDIAHANQQRLEPECVRLLLAVRKQTGCIIILTSTWKDYELDRDKLISAGIYRTGIDSQTTPMWQCTNAFERAFKRGLEVEAWVKNPHNPQLTSYAIIDDHDQFMTYQKPHFVKTVSHVGMTALNAAELMSILL
jgi:hypothetical protein